MEGIQWTKKKKLGGLSVLDTSVTEEGVEINRWIRLDEKGVGSEFLQDSFTTINDSGQYRKVQSTIN